MRLNQAQELQKFASLLDIKADVRFSDVSNGYAIQFMRVRTDDFNRAAMNLKHYQATAFPENHMHLVG